MSKKHLVLSAMAVMAVITAFAITPVAYTYDDDRPPSTGQIAFAQQVSDLMLSTNNPGQWVGTLALRVPIK